MPTGSWMPNKAKVTPFSLSDRLVKGAPHSVSKEHANPLKRQAFKPFRSDQ